MDNTLAIFDIDIEYANQLMNYIKRNHGLALDVHVFTNQDSLIQYALHNPIGILLIGENLSKIELIHDNIKHIAILWEGIGNNTYDYPCIHKYQSAKQLLHEVFELYPPDISKVYPGRETTHMICVYGLDRKKLQELFSYSLAKEYGKTRKTLYINLQQFPIIHKIYNLPESGGITDVIYYLRHKSSNLLSKLEQAIVKIDNIDCIYGIQYGLELNEISIEDINMWINHLSLWKQYERIVFDVGNINKSMIELLRQSNEIILLLQNGKLDNEAYNVFTEQLMFAGYYHIVNNIYKCKLPLDIREEDVLAQIEDGSFGKLLESVMNR